VRCAAERQSRNSTAPSELSFETPDTVAQFKQVDSTVKLNCLLLDGDETTRQACVEVLHSLGVDPLIAGSISETFAILEKEPVRLILMNPRIPWPKCRKCCDRRLVGTPNRCCTEVLKAVLPLYTQIDVLVVTSDGPMSGGAEGTKVVPANPAAEVVKLDQLKTSLARLLGRREQSTERRQPPEAGSARSGFGGLIGTSPPMREVYRFILKVCQTRHPVLIHGETGTGKELVARAIHDYSPWRDEPFVPIDCGALTPTLIESALFGHVRGAFTGASQAREGLLALARAGTAFLDEIAELSFELQAKLLRVLQEGDFRPLGSDGAKRLRARVIVASNKDSKKAVEQGRLREDLYFRLNVISVTLPPLRERKSDIPALVAHFLRLHQGAGDRTVGISDEAMARLVSYNWPGNVRELENCIRYASVFAVGPQIRMADLSPYIARHPRSELSSESVLPFHELERRALLEALKATAGNRLRAARLLGIGKTTMYRKLREFGSEQGTLFSPSG